MSEGTNKKRKPDPGTSRRPASKKVRRQYAYSSGSSESEGDEEFVARDAPVDPNKAKSTVRKKNTENTTSNTPTAESKDPTNPTSLADEVSGSSSAEEASATDDAEISSDESSEITSEDGQDEAKSNRKKTKRRDPGVFSDSIAAILSSKLPTSKRHDPVLARSKAAEEANHEINEERLEIKAKRKLRDEKRQSKDRGRVTDVLLGDRGVAVTALEPEASANDSNMSTADIVEQERRLRKTAQRGVVKLFNAVRAAQVRSEQAQRAVRTKGVIGHQQREEKVGEMGRQAFLDMVSAGGNTKRSK